MSDYKNFIKANYIYDEKINIMSLSKEKIHNYITKAGDLLHRPECVDVDCYMSMNPLVAKNGYVKRDKEHVGRLRWLYVDLDFYNSAYKDFTKDQILGLLELDYFGQEIPLPTYVIDSGRGIYVLWKINEHVKAFSRWEAMQRYLTSCLEEFGADKKIISDSARVLRKVGSINSKSGTKVCIMYHQEIKYSLTSLMRNYVISDKPSEKMIKYARQIANILEIPGPDMKDREAVKKFIHENKEPANLFYQHKRGQKAARKTLHRKTAHSLISGRVHDLEKLLLNYRDMEGGCREHILFLYRYWQSCLTGSVEEGLKRTLELNAKLRHPLELKEVVHATASADKYFLAGRTFRCSNSYVIDALKITSQEMQDLAVFVSGAERTKRKQCRNRKLYQKKLLRMGARTKKDQIRRRQDKIRKLLKRGLTVEEICKKLSVSRATFYADKQCIERTLAAKKERKKNLSHQYQEYKKMEEKCLKNSAFVLNMSFRTCPLPFGVLSRAGALRLRQLLLASLRVFSSYFAMPWRDYSLYAAYFL